MSYRPYVAIACLFACLALASGVWAYTATADVPVTPGDRSLVISEIAWGGTAASSNDEWLELHNPGKQAIDLSGWHLTSSVDSLQVALTGTVAPGGFFLLERTDDSTISDIPADLIYTGGLVNGGERVTLTDGSGTVVDSANGDGGAWPAGSAGPGFFSMERTDPYAPDDDGNWNSNDGLTRNGLDANGDAINGTPRQPNSSWVAPPTPTVTPTPTTGFTATPYPDTIRLNEFMPDPASDWNGNGVSGDADDEYVELFNTGALPVDLGGWLVDDAEGGSTPFVLPAGTQIDGGGFLVLFSADSGIALNNGGDQVRLLRPDGAVVDLAEYSSSQPDVAYSRPVDGSGTWTTTYPPSPGASNQPPPTATATATATETPTASATITPTAQPSPTPYPQAISLNEFMPDPASDWNGNGVSGDADDEYIEIFNGNPVAVDLSGWLLDDVDDGRLSIADDRRGTDPYALPPGTVIPANGILVFYRNETGVALNNDGDWVRLLRPDGTVAEAFQYGTSRPDEAYSKTVDGGDQWTRGYPPSPGSTNTPGGTPTSTPTFTPVPTATGTVTPAATPPVSPTPPPTGVMLNEFLARPASDWNGDGDANADDEYIELYNDGPAAVNLAGWYLDDRPGGSAPYAIPAGTIIPGGGLALFFRSQTGVALNDSGGDSVRLLRPDGVEADRFDYSTVSPDGAFSRAGDGSIVWTQSYPPSPGEPNNPGYTADDVIQLNEVLASPQNVDWDGDGEANYLDEWIELVNAGATTVDLGGWTLRDGPPEGDATSGSYQFPYGTTMNPGEFLVIFRRQSGLALDASDEWVRLFYPDGVQAASLHMYRFSGYDDSWCRLPDASGAWTIECAETPGRANAPGSGGNTGSSSSGGSSAPPYDRFNHNLMTLAQARSLVDGTRVTGEGQVTVLPGLLGERQAYIQDATGGMLVYLRSAQWPTLSEGQWIRVNGPLDTYNGEKEFRLTRIDDIKVLGPAMPPAPLPIATGAVNGDGHEGRLVQISGAVTGFRGDDTLYLDDGSGNARVVIYDETGVTRPWVEIGEVWTVTGVVSQWDDEAPFDGGYRLLPRRQSDLQKGRLPAPVATGTSPNGEPFIESPPLFLPVAGAAQAGSQ